MRFLLLFGGGLEYGNIFFGYDTRARKKIKFLSTFFKPKNLRWHLSKHIIAQYSIEHSKDKMMMMLQGLYYLSLYYVSILFWYSITHLFLSIFFFSSFFNENINSHNKKQQHYHSWCCCWRKNIKSKWKKEEWEAFKL